MSGDGTELIDVEIDGKQIEQKGVYEIAHTGEKRRKPDCMEGEVVFGKGEDERCASGHAEGLE